MHAGRPPSGPVTRASESTRDLAIQLEALRSDLVRWAASQVGSTPLAEDIAQETLARLLQQWRTGSMDARELAAYAFGIARHVNADLVRKKARESVIRRRSNTPATALMRQRSPSPLAAAARDELKTRIRAALDQLSEEDRHLLERCFFNDLSCAEIARERRVPAPRIRKRKSRALARLRKTLEESPGHWASTPGAWRIS